MNERFAFDARLAASGLLAGADEAGRGCLAGPIVAAAVCFHYGRLERDDFEALAALDDSKRLTKGKREALYGEILNRATSVVVLSCSAESIDRRGLHVCNLQALGQALEGVVPRPAVALVDGFALPGCAQAHEAVVGGDGLSAAIAAASVVAKVTRDRLMAGLHRQYPAYGFDSHAGYATVRHREAIEKHGVCEVHRRSFASVAYRQLDLGLSGPASA